MNSGWFANEHEGKAIAQRMHNTLRKFALEQLLYEGPILDLGCGVGNVTTALQREFPYTQVVGIDVMPYYLANEKELAQGRAAFARTDISKLPIKSNSVPIAFSRCIYDIFTPTFTRLGSEYGFNYDSYYKIPYEIRRILKPGGVYVGLDSDEDFRRIALSVGDMVEKNSSWWVVKKPSLSLAGTNRN